MVGGLRAGQWDRLEDSRKTHRGRLYLPHLRVPKSSEAGCPVQVPLSGASCPGWVILPPHAPCSFFLVGFWLCPRVWWCQWLPGRLAGGSGSVCSRCTCGRGTIAWRIQLHGGGGELEHLTVQVVGQPQHVLLSQELQIPPLGLHVYMVYLLPSELLGLYAQGLGHPSRGCTRDRKGDDFLGFMGAVGLWFLGKLG